MKGGTAMWRKFSGRKFSLLRLCGFLFAFLALSAMSECPGPSTGGHDGGGGGGMGDSGPGGGGSSY